MNKCGAQLWLFGPPKRSKSLAVLADDVDAVDDEENDPTRPPATRADCAGIPRPCNRTKCRNNLHVDDMRSWVKERDGSGPSCVLDVVDEHPHGMTFVEIGEIMKVTKERVRQNFEESTNKAKAAVIVKEAVEEILPKLPPGITVKTIYPPNNHGSTLMMTFVFDVRPSRQWDKSAPNAKRYQTVGHGGSKVWK